VPSRDVLRPVSGCACVIRVSAAVILGGILWRRSFGNRRRLQAEHLLDHTSLTVHNDTYAKLPKPVIWDAWLGGEPETGCSRWNVLMPLSMYRHVPERNGANSCLKETSQLSGSSIGPQEHLQNRSPHPGGAKSTHITSGSELLVSFLIAMPSPYQPASPSTRSIYHSEYLLGVTGISFEDENIPPIR